MNSQTQKQCLKFDHLDQCRQITSQVTELFRYLF